MIIYKTTNLINGKFYIGQDNKNNEKYFGSGLLITKAIKKYGINNFKKEILEFCSSKKELNEREIFWIEKLNSMNKEIGYNISKGGTGGKLVDVEAKKGKTYEEYYGVERSNEIKLKFSQKRKGKPNVLKNITREEVNIKISEGNKGKERTEINKIKISDSLKNFYKTEEGKEQKENLRKIRLGVPKSEDFKNKVSEKMKGIRPKILDVHPSARYWFFYDRENNLILKTLGDRTQKLKDLKTNQKRIAIFDNEEDCLNYELTNKQDYKVYWIKYYNN